MKEYMKIFVAFFKIGLFTFGGGYAMLPMFRKELMEKEKYVTEDELMDYYSIGQCTPGIIAVNVATFAGYKIRGIMGAVVATLAIVLPSLIVIMSIAEGLKEISDAEAFVHIANGVRVGVIVLLLNEIIQIFRKTVKNRFQLGMFFGAVLFMLLFGLGPVLLISMAGVVGGVKYFLGRR